MKAKPRVLMRHHRMIVRKKALNPFFYLMFIVFFVACDIPEKQTVPRTQKGIIDLSTWDFDKDDIVELNGPWAFYWQKLLTPDDFLNPVPPQKTGYIPMPSLWIDHKIDGRSFEADSFATYRLQVKIKPSRTPLKLTLSGLVNAYRLWVNGTLLSQDGVVSVHGHSEISGKHSITLICVPPLQQAQESLELVLQLSNHRNKGGGAYFPFRLGSEKQIMAQWDHERWFLVFSFGITLIMGCYHLVLYFLRPKDMSPLYFGIFCFLWSAQFMSFGAQRWMIYFLFPDLQPLTAYYIDTLAYFFFHPVWAFLFSLSLSGRSAWATAQSLHGAGHCPLPVPLF